MTNAELKELVHLLMMCGIMDKTALDSGNVTNEEWLRMKSLIDKYQAERTEPEVQGDLISREALLKAMKEERQYLLARGLTGAEHILVHHCLPLIDNAPTVEPFEPDYVGGERLAARQRGYEEGYHTGLEIGKTLNPKIKQGEWIPVIERLPESRDWYLGVFKEPDTGYIVGLPFVCDYVGYPSEGTTNDAWILRGLTDIDNPSKYYKNLECVAWQPLPEPYKKEGTENG